VIRIGFTAHSRTTKSAFTQDGIVRLSKIACAQTTGSLVTFGGTATVVVDAQSGRGKTS
jgi:hypothetical protein